MPEEPRSQLPVGEKEQPDPLLQIDTGRTGSGGLALFVIAAIAILCVVFYGLTTCVERTPSTTSTATNSPPPAAFGEANSKG